VDQLFFRLPGGHPRDLLEPLPLLAHQPLRLRRLPLALLLAGDEPFLPRGELPVALLDLAEPLVQAVFPLCEAALDGLDLGSPLARHRLELGASLQELLLGRELGLLDPGFGLPLRRSQEGRRLFTGPLENASARPANHEPADPGDEQNAEDDLPEHHAVHGLTPPVRSEGVGGGGGNAGERTAPGWPWETLRLEPETHQVGARTNGHQRPRRSGAGTGHPDLRLPDR